MMPRRSFMKSRGASTGGKYILASHEPSHRSHDVSRSFDDIRRDFTSVNTARRISASSFSTPALLPSTSMPAVVAVTCVCRTVSRWRWRLRSPIAKRLRLRLRDSILAYALYALMQSAPGLRGRGALHTVVPGATNPASGFHEGDAGPLEVSS